MGKRGCGSFSRRRSGEDQHRRSYETTAATDSAAVRFFNRRKRASGALNSMSSSTLPVEVEKGARKMAGDRVVDERPDEGALSRQLEEGVRRRRGCRARWRLVGLSGTSRERC
jgi:hypothetical protein